MAAIKTPFANSGTRAPIPESSLDGSISMVNGYSSAYELPSADPSHKLIDRATFNQLLYLVSSAIKEIQERGAAPWFSDLAPYALNAHVFHDGKMWRSTTTGNTSTPGVSGANWEEANSWNGLSDKPAVIAAGADAADARAAIGAGTSSLVVGSGAGDAKAGNYSPPNAGSATAGVIKSRVAGGVWYVTTNGSNP